MDTPCINICAMEEDTGLCAGCWRTLDEIMAWPGLSRAERRRIMATLDARRQDEASSLIATAAVLTAGVRP